MSQEPSPASLAPRLYALEAAVRARTALIPRVGLVLGSGLGGLADLVGEPVVIPFSQLPGWPAASAPGHAGRLVLGRLEGVPVACLQGRLHMYEGLSALQVVEPALLMHRLGARTLVLTNAAGGVDPSFEAGTLMLISDHLNLTGRTPLLGPNDDAMGPRFLDLTAVYDPAHRAALRAAAATEGVTLAEGVYAGLLGPTYETPAEVRMLGTLGAHAVGMSTVMEAIAAHWVGMRVVGVSLVTNKGAGLSATPLTHDEVLVAANDAGPRLARVLSRFVRELPLDACTRPWASSGALRPPAAYDIQHNCPRSAHRPRPEVSHMVLRRLFHGPESKSQVVDPDPAAAGSGTTSTAPAVADPAAADTETIRRIAAQLDALPMEQRRFIGGFAYVLGRAANADLDVSADEVSFMERTVVEVGGLTEAQAVMVVQIARSQSELQGATEDYLVTREFAAAAALEDRQKLLRLAFSLGAVDDSISAEESAEINEIGKELGFTPTEIDTMRMEFADKLSVIQEMRRMQAG